MRPLRPRFTLRTMIGVIATLAVSWAGCSGFGHMTIYGSNRRGERAEWEDARIWAIKKDERRAADSMRSAAEWARRNRESRNSIVTAGALGALGVVLLGVWLALAAWQARRRHEVSRAATRLRRACSTGATILLVGLALGCAEYAAGMLVVLITSE
jgi:hypothetical protein